MRGGSGSGEQRRKALGDAHGADDIGVEGGVHGGAGSGAGVGYGSVVHDDVDCPVGFLGVVGGLDDCVVVGHVEVDELDCSGEVAGGQVFDGCLAFIDGP